MSFKWIIAGLMFGTFPALFIGFLFGFYDETDSLRNRILRGIAFGLIFWLIIVNGALYLPMEY